MKTVIINKDLFWDGRVREAGELLVVPDTFAAEDIQRVVNPSVSETNRDEIARQKERGKSRKSQIHVTSQQVNFGNVRVGEIRTRELQIRNRGNLSLTISAQGLSEVFSVENTELRIVAGERLNWPIDFSPKEPIQYKIEIILITNDPETPTLSVILEGRGGNAKAK